jgi:hypothetical protein
VDVSLEDGRVQANMEDDHKIVVQDIVSETTDELEFRDKVIKLSLGNLSGLLWSTDKLFCLDAHSETFFTNPYFNK